MAKSISNGTDVTRVSDADAARMIAQGGWHYVPKNKFCRAARNYVRESRLAMQRGRAQSRRQAKVPNRKNGKFLLQNAIALATQGRYGVDENGHAVKR
jgi:hypothetical protein